MTRRGTVLITLISGATVVALAASPAGAQAPMPEWEDYTPLTQSQRGSVAPPEDELSPRDFSRQPTSDVLRLDDTATRAGRQAAINRANALGQSPASETGRVSNIEPYSGRATQLEPGTVLTEIDGEQYVVSDPTAPQPVDAAALMDGGDTLDTLQNRTLVCDYGFNSVFVSHAPPAVPDSGNRFQVSRTRSSVSFNESGAQAYTRETGLTTTGVTSSREAWVANRVTVGPAVEGYSYSQVKFWVDPAFSVAGVTSSQTALANLLATSDASYRVLIRNSVTTQTAERSWLEWWNFGDSNTSGAVRFTERSHPGYPNNSALSRTYEAPQPGQNLYFWVEARARASASSRPAIGSSAQVDMGSLLLDTPISDSGTDRFFFTNINNANLGANKVTVQFTYTGPGTLIC